MSHLFHVKLMDIIISLIHFVNLIQWRTLINSSQTIHTYMLSYLTCQPWCRLRDTLRHTHIHNWQSQFVWRRPWRPDQHLCPRWQTRGLLYKIKYEGQFDNDFLPTWVPLTAVNTRFSSTKFTMKVFKHKRLTCAINHPSQETWHSDVHLRLLQVTAEHIGVSWFTFLGILNRYVK